MSKAPKKTKAQIEAEKAAAEVAAEAERKAAEERALAEQKRLEEEARQARLRAEECVPTSSVGFLPCDLLFFCIESFISTRKVFHLRCCRLRRQELARLAEEKKHDDRMRAVQEWRLQMAVSCGYGFALIRHQFGRFCLLRHRRCPLMLNTLQIEQQRRLAQYAAAAGHTATASAASGVVVHGGADVDALLDAGSEPAMHAFLSHMRETDALARQMVLDGRGVC